MVAAKSWISELALRLRSDSEKKNIRSPKHPPTLGILSFETAKTMSRLLSLYKSLSEAEFSSFRRSVIRSQGVRLLNSCDEPFLLRLACFEKMDDLDRSAATVAALASRCRDIRFHDFGRTYAEMKLVSFDLVRFAFPACEIDRRISKMEGMVSSTSDLYTGLEILADMEAAERRMARWKNHPAPSPLQKPNSELFEQKLTLQRRSVRRVRDVSLWSQPFDKVVALMARFICNVYIKICVVFGPYVSDIPLVISDGSSVSITSRKLHFSTCDWGFPPLKDPNCIKPSPVPRRHLFRAFRHEKNRRQKETQEEVLVHGEFRRRERVMEAEATTLGGAALATRYANVIIMSEKMAMSPETVEEEMREGLFQMLPWRMRVAVKQKMRQYSVPAGDGWKEVEGILGWLAPMAHDMIRWQVERTFVAKKEFEPQPSVMLLQTLYFSDRIKAEAVIVELLVGLSSVYRQERRRRWPLAFSIGW